MSARNGKPVGPGAERNNVVSMGREQAEGGESTRQAARRAAVMFDDGRGDPAAAMTQLARAFPSLRQADGIEPFDASDLAQWALGGKSHGESCSVRFILSVWNCTEARDGAFGLPYFDVQEALGVWDRHHQQAFAGWVEAPWWP